MRPNVVRGRGFRGALEYDLGKKGALIVGGNMAGENPRDLAHEFGVCRSLRPDCETPVWHTSLSAAPGEKLSPEQWQKAAKILMAEVGMAPADHMFVVTEHVDTEHAHVHVLACRIGLDGSIAYCRNDADAAQRASDKIERELGLVVTRDRDNPRFQPQNTVKCSKKETEMWLRKGVEIPPKFHIAACLDEALQKAKSWEDLAASLELNGIQLQKNPRGTGYRLNFTEPVTLEECSYKASDIGKAFSYKHVAQQIEENSHGQKQNRPNEGEGSGAGRERSVDRNTGELGPNKSAARRDFDNHQDTTQPVSVSNLPDETSDFGKCDNGESFADGDSGVARNQGRQSENEGSELGQDRPKISSNDAGDSSLGAAKSLSIEGGSMDREALKIQVQEAIKEVLAEAEGERIELMKFAAALKERRIEAKLHYNERLKRIMGFGLDVEGEHYQGHEVGIPWQSIRERIELPGGMKKLDKPVLTISSSPSSDLRGTRRTREEALEAARIRVPDLFDGIEMSKEDGWGLFSNNTGEVLFFENPDGNSIRVNQNTYEAVAAALVYGHERWQGDIEVTKKDPEFASLCLKAADEYGIPISNRDELERIVHGDMKPASTPKATPKTPFSAYAETLEKLIEYEGYASLGDNEAIKAGLRKKLDEMVQHGVEVTPGDLKALAEKLSSEIGYPEQSCIAEEYLQQLGHVPEFEDWQDQRPDMGW